MEGSGEAGGEVQGDPAVAYSPDQFGIQLGTNECLDRCWAHFQDCLRQGRDQNECLAQLSHCQRNCAEQGPPSSGGEAPSQPCDQGCPTCASELQISNPCNQVLGHQGGHTCSNGHSW